MKRAIMKTKTGWAVVMCAAFVVAMPFAAPGTARAMQSATMKLTAADPQIKDDLLAGTEKFAQGASDVTDVNLDSRLMGLMGKQTAADLARKLDFIVVRSYTYDKPGMYRPEDVEAYQKRLADGSWACFVHVRERKSGESTDICSRQAPDHETNELVIITADPKELTFVHIKGRMSLDDLRNIGNSGGLPAGSYTLQNNSGKK